MAFLESAPFAPGPNGQRQRAPGVSGLIIALFPFVGAAFGVRPAVAEELPATAAVSADSTGIEFFEKRIRPVLIKQCYDCHSQDAQAKGGLRLDTRQGVITGGSSGASLVPGKPEESLLIAALKHEGPEMPPAGKLSDETIADFEEWIRLGAPDPRESEVAVITSRREIDFDRAREAWAYQPPKPHAPPEVQNTAWPRTTIDRFVLAKLEAAGLSPAPETDRATWLRRVVFDLTGLPPTPAELLDFELDASADAKEKVVDRLLESPRFGERWGRHWLDVARYAESTGKERNFVYLQAWRYRDYVIDSFNQDKPFDQFVREQVAGDLLPHASDAERDAHLIATGFLAVVPRGVNERNREAFLLDIADEQVDSVTRGLMGISAACARCHDHKFDPIPTTDYYALAGIFRSTDTRAGIVNRMRYANNPDLLIALAPIPGEEPREPSAEVVSQLQDMDRKWRELNQQIRKLRDAQAAAPVTAGGGEAATPENNDEEVAAGAAEAAANEEATEPPATDLAGQLRQKQKQQKRLEKRIERLRGEVASATVSSMAMGAVDRTDPANIAVRVRGEVDKVGPEAPRGFLTILKSAHTPTVDPAHSGRAELAQWITSRDNPLTARVFVNRVWQKLLGVGIVPTVDDFGEQGQPPSHPELLDDLAVRFMEGGWSTKRLVREIVLSQIYALGTRGEPRNQELDGENKLLWRWNRRRLESEALRDSLLSVAGQLDLSRPHTSGVIDLGARELGPRTDYTSVDQPARSRSVYLPVIRGRLTESLALFDMPDPSLLVGQREVTSGPSQALFLMNSPFVLEQSGYLAQRLLQAPVSDETRIELAYRTVLGRRPTRSQIELALKFIEERQPSLADASATGDQLKAVEALRKAAWASFCQALIASPEFRYLQ